MLIIIFSDTFHHYLGVALELEGHNTSKDDDDDDDDNGTRLCLD